jgi:RES domain-containing protein
VSTVVWRVADRLYTEPPFHPFDGEGARLYGGRWNNAGIPVVYAAGACSLALLEVLVHVPDLVVLQGYVMFRVEIPDGLIAEVPFDELPANWNQPGLVPDLRRLGDDWAKAKTSVALKVPSAIVPVEFNYVINPRHPDFERVEIGPRESLPVDPRLLKK